MSSPSPFAISPQAHLEEVLAHRKARVARLTAERGWLSLVNKVWLREGSQRIGSAPGSEILLAEDRAPADVGTFIMKGPVVRFQASPSAEVHCRGEKVTEVELRSDADPDPHELIIGSLAIELISRGGDLAIRVRDTMSPQRLGFRELPAYPIDATWRVVARFDPFHTSKEVILENGDGKPEPYLAPGVALFERDGRACRLQPVLEGKGDRKRLFVLFGDPTNRHETYGAGRFLYAPLPVDGYVLLDFNKCFNPPCAFTPYAVCPLPSKDNHLDVRVEAGEKNP